MQDPVIHAVVIRGHGPDENGVNRYEWLTSKEFMEIAKAINYGNSHVLIGGELIQARDVLQTKAMRLSHAQTLPSFKPYVLKSLKKEKQELQKLVNRNGQAKLDALKSAHRLGGGTR